MKSVKVKPYKELKELMREGKIGLGLPGQGDMDESLYISIKEGGATYYFNHDNFDDEKYLIVDHWHPIHPTVYNRFKTIFENEED